MKELKETLVFLAAFTVIFVATSLLFGMWCGVSWRAFCLAAGL